MRTRLMFAITLLTFAPFLAFAQSATTTEDVSASPITSLETEVEALITQLAAGKAAVTSSSSAAAPCVISRALSLGATGDDVACVQNILILKNLLAPDLATGYFGRLTQTAVEQFQSSQGIVSSGTPATTGYGLLGPRTRMQLLGAESASAPAENTGLLASAATPLTRVTPVTAPPAYIRPFSPVTIQLAPLIQSPTITVQNANGTPLARTFAAIPLSSSGAENYNYGWAIPVQRWQKYGAGTPVSSNAFLVGPPNHDNDATIVTFAHVPNLSADDVWKIEGAAGLDTRAPTSTETHFTITVSAGKIDPSDATSEVLIDQTVIAGQSYPLSLPLGAWTLRPNLAITIAVTMVGPNNYSQNLIFDGLSLVSTEPAPQIGVDRSNLAWTSTATQNNVIQALSHIPAAWYRDVYRSNAAQTNALLFKRIQDQGKHILVNILQNSNDYDDPAASVAYATSTAFSSLCGWSGGNHPLSKIDYTLFDYHLATNLQALRNAGVVVDAFEIGNEFDSVCFNPDLPIDQPITDAQLPQYAGLYAQFLEHAVAVVHEPQFYPNAQILTFGIANANDKTLNGFIEHPGVMLSLLSNINGHNDLDLVNQIGLHIYPSPTNLAPVSNALNLTQQQLGANMKPVWFTEFGFRTTAFSSPGGKSLYRAYEDFYDSVARSPVPVTTLSVYAVDDFPSGLAVVDKSYNPLFGVSEFFNQ